jgi:hypothetical protein
VVEGSWEMRVRDRKIIVLCTWTIRGPQYGSGRTVKRDILYFSFRQHKTERILCDKTNSVSSLIPQVHRSNNTFLQWDKHIKYCLLHLLFVLC